MVLPCLILRPKIFRENLAESLLQQVFYARHFLAKTCLKSPRGKDYTDYSFDFSKEISLKTLHSKDYTLSVFPSDRNSRYQAPATPFNRYDAHSTIDQVPVMPQTIPDLYIRIDSQTYYQWRVDPTGYIRLDALKSGRKCTPGKTVECGNVCRKPENCKKKGSEAAPTQAEGAGNAPVAAKKGRSGAAKQAKPKPQTETQAKGIVKPLETAKLPVVPPTTPKKPRAKKAIGTSAIGGGEATPVKEKKVSPAKESSESQKTSKFGEISDRKQFNEKLKEWGDGIKTIDKLNELSSIHSSIESNRKQIKEIQDSGKSKARVLNTETFKWEVLPKDEAINILSKKTKTLESKAAKFEKLIPRKAIVDSDRINAASTIYTDMKESLRNKKNTAGGVVGEDGKMKAAYTYRKEGDSVYVDYLVTSPDNLLEGGSPAKGSGTQALKQLVQKSIDMGLDGKLTLFALEDAIPFYKKLGFEGEEENLTLSPEAAKRLLAGK